MERSFKFRLISTLSISFGAILIIVVVIAYLGFDVSSKASFISNSQGEILKSSGDIKLLTKLKEQEKIADVAFFKLNNALPKRDSLFSVSRDMSELAKNRGLSFSSKFGAEISPTENKPGSISMNMNAIGSYTDVVAFTRDVEMSSYFINLVSLDIVRQGPSFNAILNGQVFFSD